MSTLSRWLSLIPCALLLACGQAGPLYLPEPEPAPAKVAGGTPPAEPAEAPADDESGTRDDDPDEAGTHDPGRD